jgi:2-phospho-L-lactate guanylyltransferase
MRWSAPTVAVVPLRGPSTGKTRLADVLGPEQRRELAIAMVTDVIDQLQQSSVDDIVMAVGGADAAAVAGDLGVSSIHDPPGNGGLDGALTGVVAQLPRDVGVLVVTGDLPHLTASEVDRLLDVDRDVVVAPCTDGGTGGLLQRPGSRLGFAYGNGSAARHVAAARRMGRTTRLVASPGFEHDVDTPGDMERAVSMTPLGTATDAVLGRLLSEVRTGHRSGVVA